MQTLFSTMMSLNIALFLNRVMLYIDPGSGSIILQAVIAGVVGVLMFFKYGWRKVQRFFGVKKAFDDDYEEDEDRGEANKTNEKS